MVSSKGILLTGLVIAIAGILINYFSSMAGVITLHTGQTSRLSASSDTDTTSSDHKTDLDLILTLDSLTIHPYHPDYVIEVRQRDTTIMKDIPIIGLPPSKIIDYFSLTPMKIRKIGKTDLRFRLKNFFPDFAFEYTYPDHSDTIKPKAPGIILELKTKGGPQVVTLRSNHSKSYKLDDVVKLGASLEFYWDLPLDSIAKFSANNDTTTKRIVFAGATGKMYFLFNGKMDERPFKEKFFYGIPNQDSAGFTILHCFPDIAYMNAVPSSKSDVLVNPVAQVEIWKLGGRGHEAYIYPETNGRKGGEFPIPDSDYMLSLGIDQEKVVQNCDCIFSIKNQAGDVLKTLALHAGIPGSFHGYKFKTVACNTELQNDVTIKVTRHPGNIIILIGVLLSLAAIGLLYVKKS
ncbi:MAG: hypothetical protein IPP15_07750 [Saprospiraceae bacterium]|uniref:DUF2330 domain-containing protein n=1 Tax=Candidatus Opimibacter skivensis TaxID=2982028 RepID=A0A9D7SUC5_9BACT|nr:hypothetical protein [Candidatus Opimibacter skivensis]